jgi:diguanylate cyclase (GGDEF)-like protein
MIFELLELELTRAARAGAQVAIIIADLDKFKSINDKFGHPAGDAVLKQASQRMKECVRTPDHVGRYGGEEFLIVLPNCHGEQAAALGERLRQAIANTPVNASGVELPITCSFGVAVAANPEACDFAPLVHAADQALYLAKHNGRNRVELAPMTVIEVAR